MEKEADYGEEKFDEEELPEIAECATSNGAM